MQVCAYNTTLFSVKQYSAWNSHERNRWNKHTYWILNCKIYWTTHASLYPIPFIPAIAKMTVVFYFYEAQAFHHPHGYTYTTRHHRHWYKLVFLLYSKCTYFPWNVRPPVFAKRDLNGWIWQMAPSPELLYTLSGVPWQQQGFDQWVEMAFLRRVKAIVTTTGNEYSNIPKTSYIPVYYCRAVSMSSFVMVRTFN